MNDNEHVIAHQTATPGWWAVLRLKDGSITSVPIPYWLVLGDQHGHYSRTEGVDVTVDGPPYGYPIPDHMLIEYRYDPREATMRRYVATKVRQREESSKRTRIVANAKVSSPAAAHQYVGWDRSDDE